MSEWENLRSQFVTSNQKHGGRRYLPNVFTEQGVAMLSAVLKSPLAIKISIQIMIAFVSIRKQAHLLNNISVRIERLESRQIEFDDKINKVFTALENADPIPQQGIFFNGQIFDAYKFASDIIKKAKKSIILIDNYIDESTLALLSKRGKSVKAIVYTEKVNHILSTDLSKYMQQYPPIEIRILKNNHDRFIIIDEKEMYHLGASLKDLGKKLFAFSRMDKEIETLLRAVEA